MPARLNFEVESLWLPVDGGDGPGDADAEEHVDGVGARHVAHRVVRTIVADGSRFRGERICAREGNAFLCVNPLSTRFSSCHRRPHPLFIYAAEWTEYGKTACLTRIVSFSHRFQYVFSLSSLTNPKPPCVRCEIVSGFEMSYLARLSCVIVQTRHTSSQCNKCNGIDGILQEDEAAQVTRHITNNCRAGTNHGDGDDEAWVAISEPCFIVSSEKDIDQWQFQFLFNVSRRCEFRYYKSDKFNLIVVFFVSHCVAGYLYIGLVK